MGFGMRDDVEEIQQVNQIIKNGVGLALLAVGVIVGLAVVWQAYGVFTQPQKLVVFQELFARDLVFEVDEIRVSIPKEVLVYLFPVALFSVAAGVANSFVNGGVKILQGSLHRMERNLGRKLTALEETLEERWDKVEARLEALKPPPPPQV